MKKECVTIGEIIARRMQNFTITKFLIQCERRMKVHELERKNERERQK